MITTTVDHNGVIYDAELCVIKRTELGYEDHGIFTAHLLLEGRGIGCMVGGYSLDTPASPRRRGTAYGLDQIIEILGTVGVETWEQLVGKQVYLLRYQRRGVGVAGALTGRVLIFAEHAAKWSDEQ